VSAAESELRSPYLPKRLRNARRDRGMTQETVAAQLGLARTSLVALEKGERAVRPEELVAMARLYGRSVDDLLRPTAPVEDFVGQFRTSLSRSADAEELEQAIRMVEHYAEDYRELERRAGVAANRPVERQLWTLAHELAHFLTRRLAAEITVAKAHSPGRVPAHERFADAFAGEFLMPTSGLTRDFNAILRTRPDGVTPGALVELAGFYGVSFQALLVRLEGLGLLARGTFDMLEHEGFSVAEARRLLGLSTRESDARVFPARYVTLAVDAYREGKISEGAFARFLRVDRITARDVARALGQLD